MDQDQHKEAFDAERAAMAALSYLGLAIGLSVAVAAACLAADYWTGLDYGALLVRLIGGIEE